MELKAFLSLLVLCPGQVLYQQDLEVFFQSVENQHLPEVILNGSPNYENSSNCSLRRAALFLGAKSEVTLLKEDYFPLAYISSKIRK